MALYEYEKILYRLYLNPSSSTVGKTPHNTRARSGKNTDCLQENKNWGATKLVKYNNLSGPQR